MDQAAVERQAAEHQVPEREAPASRASAPTANDLWVFGYGSLMWRPGFPYEEAVRATIVGFHRAFCLFSHHHRGTPARPGLVLGLDRGGACTGVAFRVAPANVDATIDYLRAREQISGVYREVVKPVSLQARAACPAGALDTALADAGNATPVFDAGGETAKSTEPRTVMALTYVIERAHPQYVGPLPLARQAFLISGASGWSGLNLEYLVNTVRHLQALGIRERWLERLLHFIGPHSVGQRDVGQHGVGATGTAREGGQQAAFRGARMRAYRWRPTGLPPRPQRVAPRFLHRRYLTAHRAGSQGRKP